MKPISHVRRANVALSFVGLLGIAMSACGDANMGGEGVGTTSAAISPIQGCDSAGMPSPSSLASMGYKFICRYVSGGSGKDITASEATALKAAGLDIVTNWETSGLAGTDVSNPEAQGVSDATAANKEAASVGTPATRPIYFSVDFDASASTSAAVNAYFKGVASVIGLSRTGAYGGYYIINELFNEGLITWGWQTYAWSSGQWESRAQLRQVQNGVDNGQLDADQGMVADYGQWGPGAPAGDGGAVAPSGDAGSASTPCTVTATGESGSCLDTTTCAAMGGTSTPDYCPGPDNIQCCTGIADDDASSKIGEAGVAPTDAGIPEDDSGSTSSGSSSGSGSSSSSGGSNGASSSGGSGPGGSSSGVASFSPAPVSGGCGVAPGEPSWALPYMLFGFALIARRRGSNKESPSDA